MDKVVISVEDMAVILHKAFDENLHCVSDDYCKICSEIHGSCPVEEVDDCPHEEIVEYRYFVRSHFRRYIVRE